MEPAQEAGLSPAAEEEALTPEEPAAGEKKTEELVVEDEAQTPEDHGVRMNIAPPTKKQKKKKKKKKQKKKPAAVATEPNAEQRRGAEHFSMRAIDNWRDLPLRMRRTHVDPSWLENRKAAGLLTLAADGYKRAVLAWEW